jgi:EAL domain-containing protein (putative c-di-GMP-specific phosphodiesterase class I)
MGRKRYNLASRIDQWMVERALTWLATNDEARARVAYWTINLSGQSLGDKSLLAAITGAIKRWDLEPRLLMFEITETAAVANLVEARTFIAELRGLGCRFALDDFGSGLSSFAYLKNLNIDCLKIDGMFVRDALADPVDQAIVRSSNEVGHLLGLTTVAEFVETDEVLQRIRSIGVDYAQGYGIASPMPLDEVLEHDGFRSRTERC